MSIHDFSWPKFGLMLLLVGLLSACGGGDKPSETLAEAEQDSALEHARKHLDPKYVCPMHPQIVRDEPGNCPICGMDLVEKQVSPVPPAASESVAEAKQDSALEHARKHLDPKYVCPMHPQIVRDEPGTCPICGMDLVEKQIDTSSLQGPSVKISGAVQQSMNIRTAKVERGTLWKFIKTVGSIAYNENSLHHVHARAAGWVEKLHVRTAGESVKRGQQLLDLYAPDILSAQVDFLIALKQSQGATYRIENARKRLQLLDVPDGVIKQIERRNSTQNTVPMLAPQSGIITKISLADGMYVTPGLELYTIADLSSVWVFVDVFENEIAWVEVGKNAEINVPAYPGRTWEGKVEYIYPDLDPQTRTLRVRLRFDNPDFLLKPNMFADAVIYGGPKRDTLLIPREALILTGEREAVVKRSGEGEFIPVKVVSGAHRGDQVEILSGLNAGDEIVTSGQFLIDSEANIQASFARLAAGE